MPEKWDAADGSTDEWKQHRHGAGDHSGLDHPNVADGVEEGTDEEDGDDDVGKRKPIGAVGHEGILRIGVVEGIADGDDPAGEAGVIRGRGVRWGAEPPGKKIKLPFEREGGEPAQDEPCHEQDQQTSDSVKDDGIWIHEGPFNSRNGRKQQW